MQSMSVCPNCQAGQVKTRLVALDVSSGRRVSRVTGGVGVLLLSGVALALLAYIASLLATPSTPNQLSGGIFLMALLVLVVGLPGLYLAAPYMQLKRTMLTEYTCKKCHHRWHTMEGADLRQYKVLLPGAGIGRGMPTETWLEIAPDWLMLSGHGYVRQVFIPKTRAARAVGFTSETLSGLEGVLSPLNGYPLVNFGSSNGSINGVALPPDTYNVLRAWVPPASPRDLHILALRRELQGWGGALLTLGLFVIIVVGVPPSLLGLVILLLAMGFFDMLVSRRWMLLVNVLVFAFVGLGTLLMGGGWLFAGVLMLAVAGVLLWRWWLHGKPSTATPPDSTSVPGREQLPFAG